jgi:hypothetical protein
LINRGSITAGTREPLVGGRSAAPRGPPYALTGACAIRSRISLTTLR